MLGHGKLCHYELHHPMSLGDALAALFRREPRKQRPANAAALLSLGQKPESADLELSTIALTNDHCDLLESDQVAFK